MNLIELINYLIVAICFALTSAAPSSIIHLHIRIHSSYVHLLHHLFSNSPIRTVGNFSFYRRDYLREVDLLAFKSCCVGIY